MRLRRLYAHVPGEQSIYASIYLVLTPTCDYEPYPCAYIRIPFGTGTDANIHPVFPLNFD